MAGSAVAAYEALLRATEEGRLDEICAEHRVRVLGVFGSATRRAEDASDLDVAVMAAIAERIDTAWLRRLVSTALAARLAPAAGFRDVLVHNYVDVRLELLADGIDGLLHDLPEYIRQVARFAASVADGDAAGRSGSG